MKFLIKFDRLFAWVLFLSMVIFFLSGYGMTKGIITSSLAIDIHNKVLPPIVIAAFTIHGWYAIHLAFKRWQIWGWLSGTILALFFLSFVGYFGYLQYFYQTNNTADNSEISEVSESTTSNASTTTSTNTSTAKTFTLAELAKYNGQNGQPSYIAVNGKVYDVSTLFVNGTHRGCTAGADVTANFSDIHSQSILSQFEIIGTLLN